MTTRLEAILTKQVNLFLTGSASIPGDTCTISRVVAGTFSVVYTNEPCNVDDYQPGENSGLSEINQSMNVKKLTVRSTTVLKIEDQVQHAGHTYQIVAVILADSTNLTNEALMSVIKT